MKAAWYLETGSVDVLQVGEVPRPDPMPGQVLVRL